MSDEAVRQHVMRFEQPCEHDSNRTTAGVEVPGVYDGILFWECEVCGRMWHAFKNTAWLRNRASTIMRKREASRADAESVGEAGERGTATTAPDVRELEE